MTGRWDDGCWDDGCWDDGYEVPRASVRRRGFLAGSVAVSTAGLAGCLRLTGGQQTDSATAAEFAFDYESGDGRVTITYAGGGRVQAGNLLIQTTGGNRASWPELGSTAAAPDEPLREGSAAVLGPDILNWGHQVRPSETVRVVHEVDGAPTTLARFTPGSTTSTRVEGTSTPTEDSARPASGDVFHDGFDRDAVGRDYVVTAGPAADWSIESRIDGPSLDADKSDQGNGRIFLDPERFSWSGSRLVGVDFRVNDDYWKQNAMVFFEAGDDVWTVRVGVQGNAIKLNYPGSDGPVAEANFPISGQDVHRLDVRIENPRVRILLDDEERIDYKHSSTFGSGTAGLGVLGSDIGHETWFDNFRVESV